MSANVSATISIRDWFAGQALIGELANQGEDGSRHNFEIAEKCYKIADAMMDTRGEEGTNEATPAVDNAPTKESVRQWWNDEVATVAGAPKINKITDPRWRKFKLRCKDGLWDCRDTLVKNIKKSSFIRQAETSWFNFDWLVHSTENFTKLLEGNYSDKDSSATAPKAQQDDLSEFDF